MKRLVLMRHGKSDWSLGGVDHDRPLNERGRKNAAQLGKWLRERNTQPDEVLCSTATRTRQTLKGLGLDVPAVYEAALYHATANTMLECLMEAGGRTVLMIGHNPGIAAFAHTLVGAPPDHPRFADYPTCATLVADFDIPHWGRLDPGAGRTVAFVIPRDLG